MALKGPAKNQTSKELHTVAENLPKLPLPILWDAGKRQKKLWMLRSRSVMLCNLFKRQSTTNVNCLLSPKILNTSKLASLMQTIITKGLLPQNGRFKMGVSTQIRLSLTEQSIGSLRCVTPSRRFSRPTRTTVRLATSHQIRTNSTCTPRKTI